MNYMNDYPEEMREIAALPPSQQNAELRRFAGHHHRDLSAAVDRRRRTGASCDNCGAAEDVACQSWCRAEQIS